MNAHDEPGPPAPADPVQVPLAQDQRAPGQARRATRGTLISWRLPDLVDTVVLAVSELVTNAVRYGRPPVSLELRRRGQQVRVDVHDGDPTEPPGPAGEAEPDAESGRGMGIVHALADEVAVEQVDDDGKVIRLGFDVARPARSQEPPAPDV